MLSAYRLTTRRQIQQLLLWLGLLESPICIGQLLDSVNDRVEDGTHTAEIIFTTKIAYLWHFPHNANTDFIISFKPVAINVQPAQRHERTLIPGALRDLIRDMYIEKTDNNEVHLILNTPAATEIDVRPGKDGASLIVSLKPTLKPVECPETATPAKKD